MMRLLLLLGCFLLPVQNKTLKQPSDFITSDPLGNLYCVKNTQVIQFDAEGNKLHEYSNSYQGAISWVDASDPLRILLFFKDFNQVIFLDRNLAELGSAINLYDYSQNETALICSSKHGGFWIFNPEDMQAVRISSQGQTVIRSILLNDFFEDIHPEAMLEQNENLYFLLPKKGLLVLSDQGKYRQQLHIPEIESFQVRKNELIYTKNQQLFLFTPENPKDSILFPNLPCKGSQIRMEEGVIFSSNGQSISIHHPNH